MGACVRACMRACVRACVRACLRACVHARARACVRACVRFLSLRGSIFAIPESPSSSPTQFTASNPKSIRLMLPSSPPNARIVVSIFYSNPEKLEVRDLKLRRTVADMHSNTFNFSNRKPTVADPCSTNTYAAWENKIYVVLCGGTPGIKIVQVPEIVLSIGIRLNTEDFFDRAYLLSNIASLFGIGTHRIKIATGSSTSRRARRLASAQNLTAVEVTVSHDDACANTTCGANSRCFEGECICQDGWHPPRDCEPGACECSLQDCDDPTCATCADGPSASCTGCAAPLPWLDGGRCVARCGTSFYVDNATAACMPCDDSCAECNGPGTTSCTTCRTLGANAFHMLVDAGSGGGGVQLPRQLPGLRLLCRRGAPLPRLSPDVRWLLQFWLQRVHDLRRQ
jgi:hypothetical protein